MYHNAIRGLIHGHRQRAEEFGKVRSCSFLIMWTDRQTDILVMILCPL